MQCISIAQIHEYDSSKTYKQCKQYKQAQNNTQTYIPIHVGPTTYIHLHTNTQKNDRLSPRNTLLY